MSGSCVITCKTHSTIPSTIQRFLRKFSGSLPIGIVKCLRAFRASNQSSVQLLLQGHSNERGARLQRATVGLIECLNHDWSQATKKTYVAIPGRYLTLSRIVMGFRRLHIARFARWV